MVFKETEVEEEKGGEQIGMQITKRYYRKGERHSVTRNYRQDRHPGPPGWSQVHLDGCQLGCLRLASNLSRPILSFRNTLGLVHSSSQG